MKKINQYNIEEYILASQKMNNTSDGGSPAYHFDNGVVLIKYSMPKKYGMARINEEIIAEEANKKNEKGVRTPTHLGIKRIQDDQDDICWVLQERATGKCYAQYGSAQNSPEIQLKLQEKLLNAPNSHYEQCIRDLCELFHMGLELKPKNIYYDDNKETGGFTFIDLLDSNPNPLNSDSIWDVLLLSSYVDFIYYVPLIKQYPCIAANATATDEERMRSKQLYYKMREKTFQAMEKVIPNFEQFRRWVLRSYPQDVIDFFEKSGTVIGDLHLTEQEYHQFDTFIEQIVKESLEKIVSGENKFWQIRANEIRISLERMGMQDAWKYHRANTTRNRLDYEDDWDFEEARKQDLEDYVNQLFNIRLELMAKNTTNFNIITAKNDLDAERTIQLSRYKR